MGDVQPKFRELNEKLTDADAKLTEDELKDWDGFMKIIQDRGAYHTTHPSATSFKTLNKILERWPKTDLAPILNTLRLAVMHPELAKFYSDASNKSTQDGQSRLNEMR